jgi:hypothetical protein
MDQIFERFMCLLVVVLRMAEITVYETPTPPAAAARHRQRVRRPVPKAAFSAGNRPQVQVLAQARIVSILSVNK